MTTEGKYESDAILKFWDDKGNLTLTFFNHWVAGIYKVGECESEGLGNGTLLDPRSDLVILDVGNWELDVRK